IHGADHQIALLAELGIVIDTNPNGPAMIALARRHRLTVYDAAYLELALRTGFRLATLDRHLACAARAEGVPLLANE
ncbi:MAG: type II toxin-antitoxin system VapC family toxin, partial [Terriglobales bacterium]